MNREDQLRNRMKHRQLSHAFLVAGEKRWELANTIAAAWVCTGAEPPCGICSGCRKAAEQIHPDIIRADPEGEGLKAEAVRALRSDAYIRPNEAPKKVYILEHGELLNQAGQNILLKLIEEGPSYACFLFLAPNPDLLLATIRSRCEILWARGEEEKELSEDGETLARFILTGAAPEESLPFLISVEKKDRDEIARILEAACSCLIKELPGRPELIKTVDRLSPIQEACQFNIGAGHLAGWIASAL